MGNDFSMRWEIPFMVWLQQLLGSTGGSIVSFFSFFGEELVLTAIFGLLYWGFNKKAGIRIGTVLMTSLVWNPMIKNIFLRIRPYVSHTEIQCLRPPVRGEILDMTVQGYSFPSSHSTASAAFYLGLARYFRKKWLSISAAVLTLLVGVSRVAAGVHYPTDVLSGWALGMSAILVIGFLERKIRDRRILYLILFLSTVPGFFWCVSTDFYSCAGLLYGFLSGNLFEERYVRFRDTHCVWRVVLRVLLGIGCMLLFSEGLKQVFQLTAETGTAAHLLRTARYAIAAFVSVGVLPALFRPLQLEDTESEE